VSNRIYLGVHKKKTCYELMHGHTPKVSHFHFFGCKCFILKKGRKLDKFEARSVDGIFFGYASHSRAYRVLNLATNQIVETCKVTFDETEPRSQLVFECAGDDELGKEIFQEEKHELGDDEDGGAVPPAENWKTMSSPNPPKPPAHLAFWPSRLLTTYPATAVTYTWALPVSPPFSHRFPSLCGAG
jgi:hypothetical protein